MSVIDLYPRIPTVVERDSVRHSTSAKCTECGQVTAWVGDRMLRVDPDQARRLLSAHHGTSRDCEAARLSPDA